MIQKPRLKTFLTLFPLTDSVWGLRGGPEELWRLKLGGSGAMQAFCALLPYLNGQHTRDEIVEKLKLSGVDPAPALSVLDSLEGSGLVEDADPHGLSREEVEHFSDQLAFFSRFTSEGGARFQSSLKSSKVCVLSNGELGRCIARQLAETGCGQVVVLSNGSSKEGAPERPARDGNYNGFSRLAITAALAGSVWIEDGERLPDFFVFAEQAHDPAGLEAMDSFAKRHKIPWLLVRSTDAHEAWVGPLFIPGETASYVSLEARLRGNMANYQEYAAFDQHVRSGRTVAANSGGLRACFELLASIAVIEAVKLLTGIAPPRLAGKLLTFNIIDWETELHDVLKVPRLEMPSGSEHRAFPWKEAVYALQERRA